MVVIVGRITECIAMERISFALMLFVPILAAAAAGNNNSSSKAPAHSAVFIFGDSLTDVGNNNYLQYALAKSNFPWYGIDYEGGMATGRFTNGRTIADIIAEKTGIPTPPAYLSLSGNADGMLQGVNYASGGGGILNETGYLFVERLSMDKQIQYLEATKETLIGKLGADAAEKLCNDALYYVGIGSNDYINNFLLPIATDSQQYTPDGFISLLISTLGRQLTDLHRLGARKIVLNGLAPLGCIPSQRIKSARPGTCLEPLNSWASQFNFRSQKLLQRLNSELPGIRITYADTYTIVMKLIKYPQAYGFKVSTKPCCNVNTTLGPLCLPNSELCGDRSSFVFWDAFHPSDAANIVIADMLIADPNVLQLAPPRSGSPGPGPAPAPAPAPTRGRP